ncbi:13643_t:CDS:2, partial [Ambispora leptoticha]
MGGESFHVIALDLIIRKCICKHERSQYTPKLLILSHLDSNNEESDDELVIQFQTEEFHSEAQITHKKCFDCENFRTNFAWCHSCETTRFKENFPNWTTGNLQLDLIIQKSQVEANVSGDYLEYISYDQFELIEFHKAGAF